MQLRFRGTMPPMTRSAARIPGIERVDLPEARQAIPRLHTYLRQCILDGRIPPGMKLSQVALAEQDRKSTRLNSSHRSLSRMPSSA